MTPESKLKVGDRVEVVANPAPEDFGLFRYGQTGVVVEISDMGWWYAVDLDDSPGNTIYFMAGELVHRDL